jgi:hypothetical protein
MAAKKASLAATAAAVTKNILGRSTAAPKMVKMPQAVSEIHVSPDDVIPAGTIITEDLMLEAGFDDTDIDNLEAAGHVTIIEVYAAELVTSGSDEMDA